MDDEQQHQEDDKNRDINANGIEDGFERDENAGGAREQLSSV